ASRDGRRFPPPDAGGKLGRRFKNLSGGDRPFDSRRIRSGGRDALGRSLGGGRQGLGIDRSRAGGGGGEQVRFGRGDRRGLRLGRRLGVSLRLDRRAHAALQRRRRGEADQLVVIVRSVRIAGFGHGGPSSPGVRM